MITALFFSRLFFSTSARKNHRPAQGANHQPMELTLSHSLAKASLSERLVNPVNRLQTAKVAMKTAQSLFSAAFRYLLNTRITSRMYAKKLVKCNRAITCINHLIN